MAKEVEERKQIAKEELNSWVDYLEARKEALPSDDYSIDEKELSKIKENFDRFKDRKSLKLKSEEIVDFHHDYAKKFYFTIPLHPRNLMQMIHPHYGYLGYFKGKQYTFDELVTIYKN
jgi:hypothetical protein